MLPVQVVFRDIPHSPAVDEHIRKKVEKLADFHHELNSCRAIIELNQNHKHQGKIYNIRVDVKVTGKEIAITRKENEDVYVAIRDAFNTLMRKLEDHSAKLHGKVKTHKMTMRGHIKRLLSDEGYGFIEGMDGSEYYFSITNVRANEFNRLLIGDYVNYIPIYLSQGWQANHVKKIHHH